ncbi:MAG TPA: hypothetical protein VGR67_05565 [Candidatus Polarisedimenticolia bacterium]|jgi:hypothetical protein|nr:hypothetical protein [Candidatus Polarisedimenticolia bacterium]
MRSRGCAAAILLLPFIVTPAWEAPKPGRPLALVLRQLRKIPLTEAYVYGTVPPEAQAGLRQAKKHLRELILSYLNQAPGGRVSAHETREGLIQKLKSQGVMVGLEPNRQAELGYGYLLRVEVGSTGDDADLLVVSTALSVTCGDDSSLMLLRRGNAGWQPILVDEAPDYADIRGARGSLNWRASEPDSGKNRLIVIADIPPWCSSVLRPLRYRAYRVGGGLEKPVQLVSRSTDAIAIDEGYEIRADPSGFSLSYSVADKKNAGMRTRETLNYRIQRNEALPESSRPDS